MLKRLYEKGYLNYSKIILENAKILGLKADEAFILIKILDNGSISLADFTSELLITSSKLDKILADLMERGFYEIYLSYDKGVGKECISFEPLFKKLEDILLDKPSLDTYDIEKANRFLASKFNRVLTSSELEIVYGLMVEEHYSYDKIVEAVEEILAKKKILSMRTLTMTLANRKTEVKVQKEAPKALKDFFNQL